MGNKLQRGRSFIEECYRLFPSKKLFIQAFIALFGSLILYYCVYLAHSVFSASLSNIVKFFLVVIEFLLILVVAASGMFLVFGSIVPALSAWASVLGSKRVIPNEKDSFQPSVETPAISCNTKITPKELSINIPRNFESQFDKWFTTHNLYVSPITGNHSPYKLMKERMESIQEWSLSNLQRLGYLLYEIDAIATDEKGLKRSYQDWNNDFFKELGRTKIPKADSSKAKRLYMAEGIDFKKEFGFLYLAAKKKFPQKQFDVLFEDPNGPNTSDFSR